MVGTIRETEFDLDRMSLTSDEIQEFTEPKLLHNLPNAFFWDKNITRDHRGKDLCTLTYLRLELTTQNCQLPE